MSAAAPRLVAKDECGCKYFIDRHGREIVEQCVADKALSDARHRASVESASHVYRESQAVAS